jgi:hypothetical protein
VTDLKLIAMDEDDLDVLSAHVQDAVVRVEDMGLAAGDKRFGLLLNRFAWEAGTDRRNAQRRRTALRIEAVAGVRSEGIDTKAKDGVLELLSIRFTPSESPAGTVSLAFAGGGTVFLDVDYLEARLHDLGAVWAAKAVPAHSD